MRKIYLIGALAILLVSGLASAQDRPWLGIQIEDTDSGVQVKTVMPDSPAEAAGIQTEDIILSLNEMPVSTAQALIDEVQKYAPDDEVTVNIQRGEETLDITVTLGNMPEQASVVASFPMRPRLGVTVEETDEGLKITSVMPMTDSDLQVDDIITLVNGVDVANLEDVLTALDEAEAEAIEVTVLRDGEEVTIEADLLQMPMAEFGNAEIVPFMEDMMMRAGLGVQYQAIDADFAANAGLSVESGALILDVQSESAAETAGLLAGDIVTSVNDVALDAENNLSDLIGEYDAGDTITLTIQRGDEELTLEATLTDLPFTGRRGGNFRFDGPNGMPFQFDMPRDGNGFQFHFDGEGMPFDMPGNGFEFHFDGENGMPFDFSQIIPEGIQSATVVCTDEDGNEVLSFSFENLGSGDNIPFFNMPDGRGRRGLDLDKLNCEVTESDAAPAADSDL